MKSINNWDIYLVTEESLSRDKNTIEIIKEVVKTDIDVIQLREKNKSKREKYFIGKKIKNIIKNKDISFIVNDDIDIALALKADGVHLGENDLPVKVARKLIGNNKIIGRSTYGIKDSINAEKNGADYIGLGAVFDTKSKKLVDNKKDIGLSKIKDIKTKINIPIVAIGGIKLNNVEEVIENGADTAAVITAITKSDNILKTVKKFKSIIKKTKGEFNYGKNIR